MREFFRGWRRKAGCVTLVMACVLSSLWIRTVAFVDAITFTIGGRTYSIASFQSGVLGISRDAAGCENMCNTFGAEHIQHMYGDASISRIRNDIIAAHTKDGVHPAGAYVLYWWSVLILTLLSAYLILWKPRKRKAEADA